GGPPGGRRRARAGHLPSRPPRRLTPDVPAPRGPFRHPEAGTSGVFVTGTGTEVGKTVVAAAIARTLAAEGKRVAVFKPAVTGLDEGVETDHALLRRASGSSQSDAEIAP